MKYEFFDLHRHNELSTFDGFGSPEKVVERAVELGYPAIGSANHGNATDAVKLYNAAKEHGIQPILGCEVYFQPKFDKKSERYHLCLFVKNMKGWENLSKILTLAAKDSFHYKPIVTYEYLKNNSEGLICTSACVSSIFSRHVQRKEYKKSYLWLKRFKKIFKDDFYVEIQPYEIDEKTHLQKRVNEVLDKLSKKLRIKTIPTTDSHYIKEEDFDSYIVLHNLGGSNIGHHYEGRYMPTTNEIIHRIKKMHPTMNYKRMLKNLSEIKNKVCSNDWFEFDQEIPKAFETKNPLKEIYNICKKRLKTEGKWNKQYHARLKKELEVVRYRGFEDFFLTTMDYVNWAKDNGVSVGPGRGSGGNSLVNYGLRITDVDPVKFDNEFRRFLRKDKKKLPDIDLDFATDKRQDVIDYILKKYEGRSLQLTSYGRYMAKYLWIDLNKLWDSEMYFSYDDAAHIDLTSSMNLYKFELLKENGNLVQNDEDEFDDNWYYKRSKRAKNVFIEDNIIDLKNAPFVVHEYVPLSKEEKKECRSRLVTLENSKEINTALDDPYLAEVNEKHNQIIKHFMKIHGSFRYYGKHAAAVIVTNSKMDTKIPAIKHQGQLKSSYDLEDAEHMKVLKFDILGLKNVSINRDLEKITGDHFKEEYLDDPELYDNIFSVGKTNGIFQFESDSGKNVLKTIRAENFDDVMAANSMNRPGPLKLKMHEQYASAKLEPLTHLPWYEYVSDTNGLIIYQEQGMRICRQIGKLSWDDTDKIVKNDLAHLSEEFIEETKSQFIPNAIDYGLDEEEAERLLVGLLGYAFNKGHASGYSIISVKNAYYKHYYPLEFWATMMKYTKDNKSNIQKLSDYKSEMAYDGIVILLPHVNGLAISGITEFDGEKVIQLGLEDVKHIGRKSALAIEKERKENGDFKDEEDFLKRMNVSKGVNKHKKLEEEGALIFDKDVLLERIIKYNAALYNRYEG